MPKNDDSVVIREDVELLAAVFDAGQQATHALSSDRNGRLQIVRGTVAVNGHELKAGDGAEVEGEPALTVTAKTGGTEILVFDLP